MTIQNGLENHSRLEDQINMYLAKKTNEIQNLNNEIVEYGLQQRKIKNVVQDSERDEFLLAQYKKINDNICFMESVFSTHLN